MILAPPLNPPLRRRGLPLCAIAALALLCAARRAPAAEPSASSAVENFRGLYQVIKHFDFDERKAGNFEDLPMYWTRLSGNGLPRYTTAQFDHDLGFPHEPSLRVDLAGGNFALEYAHPDLRVEADAQYRVVARIRTRKLEHARAFVAAYFADASGARVPATERVSDLVGGAQETAQQERRSAQPADASQADNPPDASAPIDPADDWRHLLIMMPPPPPTARSLRLQLWVAQDEAWVVPPAGKVDPITREDVAGAAWFDDITVFRLPSVQLSLDSPGGVYLDGARPTVSLRVQNPSSTALRAEVVVFADDETAAEITRYEEPMAPGIVEIREHPIDGLSLGAFVARARVFHGDELLIERRVHLRMLPALPPRDVRFADIGIDLSEIRAGDFDGLLELIDRLHIGAVKLATPLVGESDLSRELEYYQKLRPLVTRLAGKQVDACGVLIAPIDPLRNRRPTVAQFAVDGERLATHCGPLLGFLGGNINTWQLGAADEGALAEGAWNDDTLANLRAAFARLSNAPQFVLPQPLANTRTTSDRLAALLGAEPREVDDTPLELPPGIEVRSVRIANDRAPRTLPWHLDFLAFEAVDRARQRIGAASPGGESWVELAFDGPIDTPERIADYAQRIVLALALGSPRVYVPPPFRLVQDDGHARWRTDSAYPVLRTLATALGGKTPTHIVNLPPDGVGIIFRGVDHATLVAWTWVGGAEAVNRDFDFGDELRPISLTGEPIELEHAGEKTVVPLRALPILIENVDSTLIDLQKSIELAPTTFEPQDTAPLVRVRFRNPYAQPLLATLEFEPPRDWEVSGGTMELRIGPETDAIQDIGLRIPPTESRLDLKCKLTLKVTSPVARTIEIERPLTIALKGFKTDTRAHWVEQNLIVTQLIRNDTEDTVSFTTACQAPGSRRQTGAFLRLRPGETRTQQYVYSKMPFLAGHELLVTLEEIEGTRRLNQRIRVPMRSKAQP